MTAPDRQAFTMRLRADEVRYVEALAGESDLSVNKAVEALIIYCRDDLHVVRIGARWTVETSASRGRPAP